MKNSIDQAGVVVPDSAGPRFINACPACSRMRSPAFICSNGVLMTYVTPGLSYSTLANTNHIGIVDVLLTETILVITQNPCMLLLRSQIRPNLGLVIVVRVTR